MNKLQIPIQIDVKSKFINGIIHMPVIRANGSPTIVVCYGLNGNRTELHRMLVHAGRRAEETGVILVRFDYRGLGVSDGEFWHSSIRSKIEDVMAMLDFLNGCFQDEKHTLILLGVSDGAKIASLVSYMKNGIMGLALWSPVFILPKHDIVMTSRMTREPLTKEIVYPFLGLWLGKEYLRDMKNDLPIQHIKGFNGHKLLIFGGDDSLTQKTQEEIDNEIIDLGENVEIFKVPGSGHIYEKSKWSFEVINKTIGWALDIGRGII